MSRTNTGCDCLASLLEEGESLCMNGHFCHWTSPEGGIGGGEIKALSIRSEFESLEKLGQDLPAFGPVIMPLSETMGLFFEHAKSYMGRNICLKTPCVSSQWMPTCWKVWIKNSHRAKNKCLLKICIYSVLVLNIQNTHKCTVCIFYV